MLAAKLAGILECLLELQSAAEASLCAIVLAQEEIMHHRQAIPYLGSVTPAFSNLIRVGDVGTMRCNWNIAGVVPLTDAFHTTLDYCIQTILDCWDQGHPLWIAPELDLQRVPCWQNF
jgi:hypothetical protein